MKKISTKVGPVSRLLRGPFARLFRTAEKMKHVYPRMSSADQAQFLRDRPQLTRNIRKARFHIARLRKALVVFDA